MKCHETTKMWDIIVFVSFICTVENIFSIMDIKVVFQFKNTVLGKPLLGYIAIYTINKIFCLGLRCKMFHALALNYNEMANFGFT